MEKEEFPIVGEYIQKQINVVCDKINKIWAEIMELQAYKMFEGDDTVYVERDDVLELLTTKIIETAIKELGQKRSQPKLGRWIESKGLDNRDHFYTCSECGRSINLICGAKLADYPYCHCGAKMEVEE